MRLAEVVPRELEWVQPSPWRMSYELRSGPEVVATLRFLRGFVSQALGQSADGRWLFRRKSGADAEVVSCGARGACAVAAFRADAWSGNGRVLMADGGSLRVARNVWQTRLDLLDPSEEIVARYRSGGLVRCWGRFQVSPALFDAPDLPWLAMLGWYLIVAARRDITGSLAKAS